jgi:hypothetical protein
LRVSERLSRPTTRRAFRAALVLLTEPLVLLTLIHLCILALRLPVFERLPGWFFRLRVKTLGPWYLVLALGLLPLLAWWLAVKLKDRPARLLLGLIAIGALFQHGYGWSDGRGLDGIRSRIVSTGHAEFAEVAVREESLWNTVVNYQSRVAAGALGQYARSKPPGQLMTYMATERLSRSFARDGTPEARLDALRTTAAIVWPVLSYLVLIPLFFTVRVWADAEVAATACALYLVVPSVALMNLHADQFLFPLLFMLPVAAATLAAATGRPGWAAAAGVLLYAAGFFTFPLLLAGAIAAAGAAAVLVDRPGAFDARLFARLAVGGALGFAAAFGAAAVVLEYDFWERYADARAFADTWRGWQGGTFETVYFALLNYLEFAVWLGVPLVLLVLGAVRRALLIVVDGRPAEIVLPALALLAVFVALGLFGRTKGESARLWLPLVPMCCVVAASRLRIRYGTAPIALVVLLQWLTVHFTKHGQDFWL